MHLILSSVFVISRSKVHINIIATVTVNNNNDDEDDDVKPWVSKLGSGLECAHA